MMTNTQVTWPPGPPIPAPLQTTLFLLRSFSFARASQRRYGNVFHLRIAGFGHVVYLADIDAIRDVFATDGRCAHAGEANSVLEPITGLHSLLTLDREEHLRERRLISPALHGQALDGMEQEIAKIASEEESTWPSDRPFALRPALQRITFRVIVRLVLNCEDPQMVTRLAALLEPLFNIPLTIMPEAMRHDFGPFSPWRRFCRAREQLDRELLQIISKRRNEAPGSDLLGLIVHGTDPHHPRSDLEARDELVTLLIAGHETSATALAWAFERLARHPGPLSLAREAALDEDMRYLSAVAYETLRVRPVVMDVARVIDQPLTVAGYQLPAGTVLMPAIYLVQTDEHHYQNAETFEPERFLDARPDPTTWFPFGGGRRRCVGAAFALLEIQTVLQVVLSRRSVQAPDPKPERPALRGVTFAPQRDALVTLPIGSVTPATVASGML